MDRGEPEGAHGLATTIGGSWVLEGAGGVGALAPVMAALGVSWPPAAEAALARATTSLVFTDAVLAVSEALPEGRAVEWTAPLAEDAEPLPARLFCGALSVSLVGAVSGVDVKTVGEVLGGDGRVEEAWCAVGSRAAPRLLRVTSAYRGGSLRASAARVHVRPGAAPEPAPRRACDVSGVWTVDHRRSHPLGPFLKQLGVPWVARVLIANLEVTTTIEHEAHYFCMTDTSSAGISARPPLVVDGRPHMVRGDDGVAVQIVCGCEGDALVVTTYLIEDRGRLVETRRLESPGCMVHRTELLGADGRLQVRAHMPICIRICGNMHIRIAAAAAARDGAVLRPRGAGAAAVVHGRGARARAGGAHAAAHGGGDRAPRVRRLAAGVPWRRGRRQHAGRGHCGRRGARCNDGRDREHQHRGNREPGRRRRRRRSLAPA